MIQIIKDIREADDCFQDENESIGDLKTQIYYDTEQKIKGFSRRKDKEGEKNITYEI